MYSCISAKELFQSGGKIVPYVIPLKAMGKFLETYVVKKGFMDGFLGLVVAVGATYSVFWKYLQLWELSRRDR